MRTDKPAEWDERSTILAVLDYARATVRFKCEGLSDEDARRVLVASSPLTTVSTLVSHLRWVEHSWIDHLFLGNDDLSPTAEGDPDYEMTVGLTTPLAQLLDEYEEQSERLRGIVAEHDLDEWMALAWRSGQRMTLRWILLHLIEETARHNGHLDLLRELTDGVTGY